MYVYGKMQTHGKTMTFGISLYPILFRFLLYFKFRISPHMKRNSGECGCNALSPSLVFYFKVTILASKKFKSLIWLH